MAIESDKRMRIEKTLFRVSNMLCNGEKRILGLRILRLGIRKDGGASMHMSYGCLDPR